MTGGKISDQENCAVLAQNCAVLTQKQEWNKRAEKEDWKPRFTGPKIWKYLAASWSKPWSVKPVDYPVLSPATWPLPQLLNGPVP